MPRSEALTRSGGYTLERRAELSGLTSFRVPARGAWLARVSDPAALPAVLALPVAADFPVMILGGGSNVLFTRDYTGLIVRLVNRGLHVEEGSSGAAVVRAAAGESWDALVRRSLAAGLSGLENLILIPGNVGAAPIQNIGAYGAELAEFVRTIAAWDREHGAFVRLDVKACAFGYRDSVFKREPGRYVVTEIELSLPRTRDLRLDYAGVREELAAMDCAHPSPMDVARAVERLRLRKLPNPAEIGNAGSFFKNPVVAREYAQALRVCHPALPVYHGADGSAKLSAAWMIEACGFKGYREGDAGVSEKHALVLVNYGAASGADIWRLAERIRAAVDKRFGVVLQPEPVVF